jgi:hypothetical protein
MLSWGEFERAEPELAEAGRGLIYQFGGVGLAFLSTVRRDGGPRVHPMCPLIFEGRLLAFLIPSPKSNDLLRDARYALHCFPPADNEDAFYVTGRARLCEEKALRKAADERFWDERPSGQRDPDRVPYRDRSADPHHRPRRLGTEAHYLARLNRPTRENDGRSRAVCFGCLSARRNVEFTFGEQILITERGSRC